MSEFQAFNPVTHPIVKLLDDWNTLLDHGLVKAASYIIRKNGVFTEAIDGSTGKIFVSNIDAGTVITSAKHAGTTVMIKDGSYPLTSEIVVDATGRLYSENQFGASLVPAVNINGIHITADNVTIEGLKITCSGTGECIKFLNQNNIVIKGNYLIDGVRGINAEGSGVQGLKIFDNFLYDCGSAESAILVINKQAAGEYNDIIIRGNYVYTSAMNAIQAYCSLDLLMNSVVIDDNICKDTKAGIFLSFVTDASISGNSLHNITDEGISVERSRNISVSGNSVYDCGYGITVILIDSDGNRNISIVGNTVSLPGFQGIELHGSGTKAGTNTDVTITGNTVYTDTIEGIRVMYNATNVTITGNTIRRQAAAASIGIDIDPTGIGYSITNVAVSGNVVTGFATGIFLGWLTTTKITVVGNNLIQNTIPFDSDGGIDQLIVSNLTRTGQSVLAEYNVALGNGVSDYTYNFPVGVDLRGPSGSDRGDYVVVFDVYPGWDAVIQLLDKDHEWFRVGFSITTPDANRQISWRILTEVPF